ncbi:MAG: hypothetical protein IPM56_11010 [Ignavibacteriales bacterium]|nr:MAG: hypothetical protein IPM56_11010 [Ignavibacteriales bacterium]
MNIIFLDIDGVMNSERYYRRVNMKAPDWARFDPESVRLLKLLLDEFDARLVITSSWRFGAAEMLNRELNRYSLKKYLHKNWKTDLIGANERDKEINSWLKKSIDVKNFLILDDVDSYSGILRNHFVKTDIKTGFGVNEFELCREFFLKGG